MVQMQQPIGGVLPVALKVMDCGEDEACSFERVYNEVSSCRCRPGAGFNQQCKYVL